MAQRNPANKVISEYLATMVAAVGELFQKNLTAVIKPYIESKGEIYHLNNDELNVRDYITDLTSETCMGVWKLCRAQHCEEGLDFAKNVFKLKQFAGNEQFYHMFFALFEQIYDTFISITSLKQVNLSAPITLAIEKQYKDYVDGWVQIVHKPTHTFRGAPMGGHRHKDE